MNKETLAILNEERTTRTVGRVSFSIGSHNKRLSARFGSHMTFIGGKKNDGWCKSVDEALKWIEDNKDALEACKSMRKLIYIGR